MVLELSKTQRIYILHHVSTVDIALSIRHLAIMLRSGIGIEEGLKVLTKQSTDLKLQETFEKIVKDVGDGVTLSEALAKYPDIFPDILVSIVEVGEEAGSLEKNLLFVSEYLKKNYELQRKVSGATTYPFIVLGMTFVEFIGVIFFILPKLETVFRSFTNIPPLTLAVLNFSDFIRDNWQYIVIGFIAIILIISRLLATKPGKRFKDQVKIVMPVLGDLNKKNSLATFSRTLGILLQSGVPLQKALSIAKDTTANIIYKEKLDIIYNQVKSGKSLSECMNSYPKLFPVTYIKMIEIAEQTASLEDNLDYLYEFYSDEVIEISNNLTTLIEPVLLVFVGLMIGGLALIIITPIYQLAGSINK